MPAFWKKTTLRSCKILYSFLASLVTNESPENHTRIGMYKKMHRLIELRKEGDSLTSEGFVFFLAIDNVTLC